jgi:predicted metal-dependent phosphoesterase TrpH
LEPAEVVARARERGVTTLALTDHDTVAGLEHARAEADRRGINLVSGIELSCRVERGSGHLLAYFPDAPPEALTERLRSMEQARATRARQIVGQLTLAGAPITFDDVASRAAGPIGRPHIADALIAAGHAEDRADAFARWIGPDGPGFVPHSGVSLAGATRLVHEAGGAPVLAHPYTLELSDRALESTVIELVDAGLIGLEVHRPDHPATLRNTLARICSRTGLIATGGSDFHHPGGDIELGDTGDPPLSDGAAARVLAQLGPQVR